MAKNKSKHVNVADEKDVKLSANKSAIKSDSPSYCRRCLSVLKYVILFLIIPPFLNYAALLQESSSLLPPGALYDVSSGQKMFLGCNGTGLPTVILDAPTGMSSDVWHLVYSDIAKLTKVCVYDRAGLGFSDRPQRNQSRDMDLEPGRQRWTHYTVERMVDDLHRLITYSSQQERPLILVGAEMGGMVARFYAQIYEADVVDVVLVDPLTEDLFTYDVNVWSHFWAEHLVPSFQAMQLSAATGWSRIALLLGAMHHPLTEAAVPLPDDVVRRQKHLLCNPRHLSSVVDEHYFINESFSQMQTVFMMKSFPSTVGVHVINGNYYDDQLPTTLNKAWAKGQQNLVSKLHPGSTHLVVNGVDHSMLYRQPNSISEPVKRLVRQWRTKQKHN